MNALWQAATGKLVRKFSASRRSLRLVPNRYLNEFSFRCDLRKVSDGERTIKAIKVSEGKRLIYRAPVSN
jgi:hypothetical protein